MADNASTSVLAFHDTRWNSWRWKPILERWGYLSVFINPDILKTTAILVADGAPDSSIFFARLPITYDYDKGTAWGYAYYGITTKHSVENRDIAIRFNPKGFNRNPLDLSVERRQVPDKPINRDDWIVHRDTDLAILPIDFSLDDYDLHFVDHFEIVEGKNYLMAGDLGPDRRQFSHRYGVGDEVFSIGLFEHPSTEHQAQPVARFGHIAFQPADGEKIFAEVYPEPHALVPIDAYLVELTSWYGQSGSPVFLCPWPREQRSVDAPLWEMNFLVGMIQGFYPGEQNVKINDVPSKFSPLNMGIGIVIPSKDIMDLLTREDVVEDRKKKLKQKQQNPKIRPQRASKDTTEDSLTKAGFENALRRASRKVPESQSKDSEK